MKQLRPQQQLQQRERSPQNQMQKHNSKKTAVKDSGQPQKSSISIRRFNSGEEAEILRLINDIMSSEFGNDSSAYPTQDLEELTQSYGELGEGFFVALDGDKIIGTVGIKKEDERIALLRRLFVSSPYRRRKIGLELIEHALKFCHEVGYNEVIFKTTSTMTSAIELCKSRGFVQRAKLELGPIELLKFSISIRNGLNSVAASE